jgi:mRNA-degrading endonuclease RelE of RelBE toxin-antitoxin system
VAALLHAYQDVLHPVGWTDWLTDSFFRVRALPAAVEKLDHLAPETQHRLRQMIQEITELADLTPPNTGRVWNESGASPLLTLQLGRIFVRYSISEDTRTVTIEHVVLLDDDSPLERAS